MRRRTGHYHPGLGSAVGGVGVGPPETPKAATLRAATQAYALAHPLFPPSLILIGGFVGYDSPNFRKCLKLFFVCLLHMWN